MLSKSKFILGQQCAKSFWLDLNNEPPTNEADDAAKDRLRAGDEVGEIAKEIFPGGKAVPYLNGKHKEMFDITKNLIKEGATTIYEASFIYDDIFVRVDLMNKTEKGWDIYEVKSSTKIKQYHEYDASIQWHVLKDLKLFILNDVFIVTLNNNFERANDEDWSTEYLDKIISVKIVDGVVGATDHINRYSSNHTESIITENEQTFMNFYNNIDSAIILKNASTQFADGGEFGFGAEIGISTDKLHVRGPVGAKHLTTFKYIVHGSGQSRP